MNSIAKSYTQLQTEERVGNRQYGWKTNTMKTKRVRIAISAALQDDALTDRILELAKHQNDY